MQQTETTQSARHALHVPKWVIVIGANTGGPQALAQILPKLPSFLPCAVVVMQRMRPGFARVLVEQLSHLCQMPVCQPEDGQALQSSRIFIAPENTRLAFESIGDQAQPAYRIVQEDQGTVRGVDDSRTDLAMASAAHLFGAHSIGILLTGLGTDGREGLRAISTAGGLAVAQDESTSIIHDLPASAIREGIVSDVLPLWNIADRVTEVIGGSANAVAA
jgi:two-component system chemotaxis response regulator CheB